MSNKFLMAAAFAACLFSSAAQAATVIFESVPGFSSIVPDRGYCSDCVNRGFNMVVDSFSLGADKSVNGFNIIGFNADGSSAAVPMIMQIFDSTRSHVLVTRTVTPTFVSQVGDYATVSANVSSFNLVAGNYWFGVLGSDFSVGLYNQGGKQALMTEVPTGNVQFALNGTVGFSLLGDSISAAPEPTSWVMMVLGVGMVGGALRRRRTWVRYNFA